MATYDSFLTLFMATYDLAYHAMQRRFTNVVPEDVTEIKTPRACHSPKILHYTKTSIVVQCITVKTETRSALFV